MKRTKSILLAMFCVSLLFGKTCPVPQYPTAESWIDQDKIIGELICQRSGYLGELDTDFTFDEPACDPDEDNQGFEWQAASQTLGVIEISGDPNGIVTVTTSNLPVGKHYIYITVIDKVPAGLVDPADPNTGPASATGTIAIFAKRKNQPPVIPICGGSAMSMRQKQFQFQKDLKAGLVSTRCGNFMLATAKE